MKKTSKEQERAPESVGDLMRKMGFRQDAPESLKKAFIKNLIAAAFPGEHVPESHIPEQLSFSFEVEPGVKMRIRRSG